MLPVWITPTLLLLLSILLSSFFWLQHRFAYFRRCNLPHLSAYTPLGNLRQLLLLRISFGELFQQIYAHGNLAQTKLAGFFMFHTPALMVRDPHIIRLVLIRHFNCFLNRYEAADGHADQMGALTLPLAKYHNWRDSRRSLSQLFTTGCMRKRMYPLMLQVAGDLEQHVQGALGTRSSKILELNHMCTLYTTDVTAKLFYSQNANGLRRGYSELRQQTQRLLRPNLLKVLHFMSIFFLPQYTRLIGAKVFSAEYAQFMREMVAGIVAKRQREQQQPKLQTGDLIDQLLKLQLSQPTSHYAQHTDFIASQAGIILLAGYETSSALLAFTLYELAKQPLLQLRLRQELEQAYANEATLSYDRLVSLPYLKMVALEALRLYPAAAFINRECTSSKQGISLQPHVDFVIPNGMPVYISILGLHRDAKYWPEPMRFDPDRFTPERIKRMESMTYIPFGAGPHGCIGSRLGVLQLKLGLAHILRLCRVEVCQYTVDEIRFNPKSFMLESKDNLYLRFYRN